MARIAAKKLPYTYGGGHGRLGVGNPGFDCSGYVSAGLGAAGWIKAPMATQQGSGLNTLGVSGAGQFLTWGVRGSSGRNAHTMMKIGNTYWESGSGHGPRRVSGWAGRFAYRHMPGYRRGGNVGRRAPAGAPPAARRAIERYGRAALDPKSPMFVGWGYRPGGIVRRFRTGGLTLPSRLARVGTRTRAGQDTARAMGGGRTGRALSDLFAAPLRDNAPVTEALDELESLLGNVKVATIRRLEALSSSLKLAIDRTVRSTSPGGRAVTEAEEALVRRARSAVSAVDAQLGLRAGAFAARADAIGAESDAKTTVAGLDLRRAGIDAGSLGGLAASGQDLGRQERSKALQRSRLEQAFGIAKRRGRAGAEDAKGLGEEIAALTGDIAELAVQQVENAREQVAAAAQDRTTAIANLIEDRTNAVNRGMRVAGVDTGSSAGLAQQAQLLAWTREQQELQRAAVARARLQLTTTGGGASEQARALDEQLRGLSSDIAETAASLVETTRAQVRAGAQEAVDAAASGSTMASLGYQRLQLEQQLDGTAAGGNAARADYIARTIVPALQAELVALLQQRASEGDPVLARQIAEQIGAKQNDLLQAQVDALEQIQANTTKRTFGGSLALEYQGLNYTDSVLDTVGA